MSTREIKIYCPKCQWAPEQSSRWSCTCGFRWNTFDTAGVCPKCSKAWEDTACLTCKSWSRHHAWYHDFVDGLEQLDEELVVEEQPLAP
jgi:hypothetical protein